MQIRPEHLETHLQKSLHPFYFLWGDEALLIQESADKIRASAFEQGFSERILFSLESEASFEWENFTQACSSYSLFSEKKIVEVILQNTKLKDPPFILNTDPNIVLLIRAGSLTPAAKKSNWFKKITQHEEAVLIPHDFLNKTHLTQWIIKEAEQKDLKLLPEVLQAMSEKNEGNVLAAHQELEMLQYCRGRLPIDLNQYNEMMTLTCQSRFTVFDLQNALLKGDAERVLAILSSLKRSEFILILWVIAKMLRTLIELQHKINQNMLLSQALQALSIWASLAPLYTMALKRLSLPVLTKALQDIQQMDMDFKTGKGDEAWRSLLNLCLQLTQP